MTRWDPSRRACLFQDLKESEQMRLLVRHSPAELMYCLQTQTPRAICTRLAIAQPFFKGWLAVMCCVVKTWEAHVVPYLSP
jgi:hypothetical protein